MKPERLAIACIVALVVLVAFVVGHDVYENTREHITSGVVQSKAHHPFFVTTTYIKSGDVLIPVTTPHPEHWTVTITGKLPNGKPDKWTGRVSEDQYRAAVVGEVFDFHAAEPGDTQ